MTPCTNSYLGDLRLHKLSLPPLDLLVRLRARNDKREWDLTTVVVRDSNDTNIRYQRVIQKVTLEFCWRNLEAADFHDLLDAIDNENIVICIDDSLIASANPSGSTKCESISEEEL